MSHILFIQSSVNGPADCLHPLDIVTKNSCMLEMYRYREYIRCRNQGSKKLCGFAESQLVCVGLSRPPPIDGARDGNTCLAFVKPNI